jgi:hypothetical protein
MMNTSSVHRRGLYQTIDFGSQRQGRPPGTDDLGTPMERIIPRDRTPYELRQIGARLLNPWTDWAAAHRAQDPAIAPTQASVPIAGHRGMTSLA